MKFSLVKNSPLVGGETSSCWARLAAESRPGAVGAPPKTLLRRFCEGGKWVVRERLAYHNDRMVIE